MQDYKLVIGNLSATAVPSQAIQSYSEFMYRLNDQYLSQGYEILSVNNTRVIVVEGQPTIHEFAYHLVKEISTKK